MASSKRKRSPIAKTIAAYMAFHHDKSFTAAQLADHFNANILSVRRVLIDHEKQGLCEPVGRVRTDTDPLGRATCILHQAVEPVADFGDQDGETSASIDQWVKKGADQSSKSPKGYGVLIHRIRG